MNSHELVSSNDELKCIIITDDSLKVLDQLMLPNVIEWIDVKNLNDTWKVIKEMRVRGAPLISVVALQGLKVDLLKNQIHLHSDYEKLVDYLKQSSIYLKTSRPTAVNLSNDLDDLLTTIVTENKTDTNRLLKDVTNFIDKNFEDYVNSSLEIARIGADLILKKFGDLQRKLNIMTICNTGKLAMPGVGTALGIIREIHRRNKLETLYIPETRPYNQGSRLTSFEAVHDKLPGILISDSMCASLIKSEKVDLIIVGADRVTRNGSTANKIGTYSLAVCAHHHGVPFYVACPWSTIDMSTIYGKDILIEERPADELRQFAGVHIAPKEIKTFNPSFDITPRNLIEAIITERGEFLSIPEHESNEDWTNIEMSNVEEYLKKKNLIDSDESCVVEDVADGNLNNVYKITTSKNKTLCFKQALPYVKCIGPTWPLSLERSLFESEGLKYEESVCKNLVPHFIHYDSKLAVIVMEFLNNHIILRNALIDAKIYNNLGKTLGEFCAKTLFYSSSIFLNAEDYRIKLNFWNKNTLCTLTEKVVFSDPYVVSNMNRWTSPQLDQINDNVKLDKELISKVHKLRQKFINKKEALIHGDLHSGSIMVGENNLESIKIIDSEFSFYGPIGYDTGNVIAHLIISWITHENNSLYQNYLKNEIITFWREFQHEFINLWKDNHTSSIQKEFPGINESIEEYIYKSYFDEIFNDTIGYTGTEIIRRILGVAHVKDFDSIVDLDKRSYYEKKAILLARELIVNTSKYCSIEAVSSLLIN